MLFKKEKKLRVRKSCETLHDRFIMQITMQFEKGEFSSSQSIYFVSEK